MNQNIEQIARIIVNDVSEFYSAAFTNEKMNKMYLHLIEMHNEKKLNLFEYNDDMFYDLFL